MIGFPPCTLTKNSMLLVTKPHQVQIGGAFFIRLHLKPSRPGWMNEGEGWTHRNLRSEGECYGGFRRSNEGC